MRQAFKTLILAMAALFAVISCTKKDPEIFNEKQQNNRVCLKLSDVSLTDLTKSAVKGTSFPTDEDVSIGIFVQETKGHIGSTGSKEFDWPYTNVKFTRAAGETKWVADKEIRLGADTVCVVYAYYPWKEGTGWDHIDVYPSVDGDDWMWATPVENVSSINPDINLTMNHALALVELTFNVSNYSEETEMTKLSVSSPGAARFSNFSFRGGVHFPYGNMTGENALSEDVRIPLKNGVIKADCLLVPAGTSSSRQDMTISCTLAGKKYTAYLSGTNGVIIRQGIKSTVSLNIKGSTIEVASVGVSDWNNGITTAFVDGHSVTVTGDVPAVITSGMDISTDGDVIRSTSQTATIRYDKSFLNGGIYELVYRVEAGSCKIDHNADEGILTVSEVTDDVKIALSVKE